MDELKDLSTKTFGFFLLWHMTGGHFDKIPWTKKSIREFILIRAEELFKQDNLLIKWYYFVENPISGVSKFSEKELIDKESCEQYQEKLRKLILKYQEKTLP